jgi:hypothetical protein
MRALGGGRHLRPLELLSHLLQVLLDALKVRFARLELLEQVLTSSLEACFVRPRALESALELLCLAVRRAHLSHRGRRDRLVTVEENA